MKRLVQIVSAAALVLGLVIAVYWWQAQNIAFQSAKDQAESTAGTSGYAFTWPTIPIEDRALGVAFGFGLAFLGAFGLYASLQLPEPDLRETEPPHDRIVI